jgi:hypothetical protein
LIGFFIQNRNSLGQIKKRRMKMKFNWRNIAAGLLTVAALTGCSHNDDTGGGAPIPNPTPTVEEWLLFAEDGSGSSNNLNIFRASASSPVQSPNPQIGNLNFAMLPLGEIHFANQRGYVVNHKVFIRISPPERIAPLWSKD